MMQSMTGYARVQEAGDWGELSWELRSVNHRYLDVSLRLPDILRPIETQLRRRATDALGRGKVECSLRYNTDSAAGELFIDRQRLNALVDAAHGVAQLVDKSAAVDPVRLLAWPGVAREQTVDQEILVQAAQSAFERCLAQLTSNRAQEGSELEVFFRERLAELNTLVVQVKKRLPQAGQDWRQRLEAKLAQLDQPVDAGRIEQEVVIAAQKSDVEEELSRLQMHMAAFEQALEQSGPVGRRLDFLMQEFNREANTLSSKSQDGELRQRAVDIKVVIEQMREQVQNVE